MIQVETRNSYSEVFELLKHINRKDLNKIPMEILQAIKENRNNEYNPNIDITNINQSLSKEAANIYTWLYLTYIAENQEEKDRIRKILHENEINTKRNLKLNENIFNKKITEEVSKENIMLVEYKPNFILRIINRIKDLFKRK